MTDSIEALIAEARDYLDRECNVSRWPNLVSQLADALESTAAELRKDREWGGGYWQRQALEEREYSKMLTAQRDASLDDLARAREVITRVSEYLVAVQNSPGLGKTGHHERWLREARDTLTTYNQAGAPR